MALIEMELGNGLTTSKLQVKLDNVKENNDICVRCDGLYVAGESTSDGSGNVVLKEYQSHYMVLVDWSPWGAEYAADNSRFKNHVCCDCKTHRCWDAEWDSDSESTRKPILKHGKNEEDAFRKEIDWVLPGDFFRVKSQDDRYEYFIITEVSAGPSSQYHICPGCGQIIYPFEETCDECGNPKWHYNDEEIDSPSICPDCHQPILKPDEDTDNLIGLAGNEPVNWASLGMAGDW